MEILKEDIGILELSKRAEYCLRNLGINTILECVRMSESTLLEQKNFGRKSVNEVKTALSQYWK